MIKAVNEVIDRILKGYGLLMTENFARAMVKKEGGTYDQLTATIGMILYGTIHALILCMEMFTIHVVLTSSKESIYSFLFYNNFNEIKIYVFKKFDIAGLYDLASFDAVERFQQIIYLINICLTTSQNKTDIVLYSVYVLISEVISDSLKHFFITRTNHIDTDTYYQYRKDAIDNFNG